jgi:hypothetical protein
MFQNEMISGLLNYAYFSQKTIGSSLPYQMSKDLKSFSYLTGLTQDDLCDGNFGHPWGLRTPNGIVTYGDPYGGYYAYNCAKLINSLKNQNNCYMDIGSGYGGTPLKVSRFVQKPLRSILVDLPLNLTTAYAYISMNSSKRCYLVSSLSDLDLLDDKRFDESHFVFVPTLFVEELASRVDSIDLLYNHGSFSEMDLLTIEFYLDLFVDGISTYLYEINSNLPVLNAGDHIEIPSSTFPVSEKYCLLSRTYSINQATRYMQSLYRLS